MNQSPSANRISLFIIVLIAQVYMVLLVACGQADTYRTSTTLPALPAPTEMPVVSTTSTPDFTPNAETNDQAALNTDQAQNTPTLTSTPSPLPFGNPPAGKADAYTLKPWNGSEAWSMIKAEPPALPQGDSGKAFDDYDWESIKLTMLREIVMLFPDSPYYHNAINLLISPESYAGLSIPVNNTLEPFRVALETAINTNPGIEISTKSLDAIILRQVQQEDIHVLHVFSADNILGDGAPGWILDVRIPGSFGAALALSGEPGAYRLISPRENWHTFMWSNQQVFTYDLNANGIPEIAIQDSYSGMNHSCEEFFQLYEWDGSSFVNLTPNIQTNFDIDIGGCLDFETAAGPNGTQAIITGIQVGGYCSYQEDRWHPGNLVIQRRYEWNGTFFDLAREEVLPLEASMPEGSAYNKCTLGWVNEAGAANAQAIQLLPTLLAETDPELTAGFVDQYGPAYLDFFRFKLGTWYAMRGRQSQALSLLTQIRDNPTQPDYKAASQLAGAFLQSYPATSAYAGCAAANQVLDITAFRNMYWPELDLAAIRTAWGFSDPQWAYEGGPILFSGSYSREDPLNVCNLVTAFRLSIQSQSFTSTESLTRWLDSQHIPYTGLEEGDLDNDSRRDWLILVGTGKNQSFHLWALLNRKQGILPVWISYTHHMTANIPAAWGTFTPTSSDALLNVYQWTDGMVIFRVVSQGDWTGVDQVIDSKGYYDGDSFLGFTAHPAETGPLENSSAEELTIFIVGEKSWEQDWYTLGWDPALNTLRVISSPRVEQEHRVLLAENLLFERDDPKAAIEILNQMLDGEAEVLPDMRPYLQYLLGLAYEINGDERDAIVAYWNIWHDFPLHPLSYVVQQKLSFSSPSPSATLAP